LKIHGNKPESDNKPNQHRPHSLTFARRAFRAQAEQSAFNKQDLAVNVTDSRRRGQLIINQMKYDRLIEGLADQIGHRPSNRGVLETARIKRAATKLLRRKLNRKRLRKKSMV